MSNYFFFDFENIFDGNVSALEIKIDKALYRKTYIFRNFFSRKIEGVNRQFREKFKKNQIPLKPIHLDLDIQ